MSLKSSKEVIFINTKKNRATGAFNILNLEMLQGVINAAEKTQQPLIIQITQSALEWAKFDYIVPMLLSATKNAKVSLAVHLDHAKNVDLIKKCVDNGFSSVMYDGSRLPVGQNIKNSLEIINYCKNKNTSVEIEIGQIGGKEDDLSVGKSKLLSKEEIIFFYNKTKPDLLAFAFGTSHGKYTNKVFKLNYELVKSVAHEVNIPLVMHGSSGLPNDKIKKAISYGISKVNIGTDLLICYFKEIRKRLNQTPNAYDIRKINSWGIKAVEREVTSYLEVLRK